MVGAVVTVELRKGTYTVDLRGEGTGVVRSARGAHVVAGWQCDCRGYHYRGRCVHVDALREVEAANRPRPARGRCRTCGEDTVLEPRTGECVNCLLYGR